MLICVTNRKLCQDNFLDRINMIAEGKPYAVMLREKDLALCEYEALTIKVKHICSNNKVMLIINHNIEVALKLCIPNIHLSMMELRKYKNQLDIFDNVGASVHSMEEAMEAQKLGADYIIAGHIYSTSCKQGVPPRGLSFLEGICSKIKIPVFAIGGITSDKKSEILKTGAKGMCIMSEIMNCSSPIQCINTFGR